MCTPEDGIGPKYSSLGQSALHCGTHDVFHLAPFGLSLVASTHGSGLGESLGWLGLSRAAKTATPERLSCPHPGRGCRLTEQASLRATATRFPMPFRYALAKVAVEHHRVSCVHSASTTPVNVWFRFGWLSPTFHRIIVRRFHSRRSREVPVHEKNGARTAN